MDLTPEHLAKIVDGVESGRIPAEHASDSFPAEVTGLSGRKFRTLVAELVGALGASGDYLEIGTFQGKTLCTSAVLNPQVRHIGVDNFSYGSGKKNLQILNELAKQLELSNLELFEEDFFNWLPKKSATGQRDIAVYYFDASHDYRSQLLALLYGAQIVVPNGVMLVDDCNYSHVRAATYDFCSLNRDWALFFERYTQGHPNLASDQERHQMDEGWWNGVHLLVHDPEHRLARLERQPDPPLEKFFLDQHRIENCVTDKIISRRARINEMPQPAWPTIPA